MLSRYALGISTSAVLCVSLFASLPAAARSRALITTPVDNSSRVQVPHSHPVLRRAVDLGPLGESEALDRMILVLKMAPEQQHALATLLDRQQTKGSPDFHRWLTPEQYGQQFGPASEDVAQLSAWLQQQGFTVGRAAKSGMWIEFSGTAATVNRAFQTQLRRYKIGGETHIANAADISIPSALVPLVQGLPLHDFFSKPALVRSPEWPAITNSAGAHAVTPGDFAAIYDLPPVYKSNLNGRGQTIAIVARSDLDLADVAQFQKIFGLPSNVPTVIDNGIPPGVSPNGDGAEAMLDAEWSGAVAPGAKIVVVPSWNTTTTDGVVLSATYIVDQNIGQIMNVSYANCEQNLGPDGNAFWNSLWQQAAAQGMSVFVASGDSASIACSSTGIPSGGDDFELAVNGLSSTPFNTSVGGTEFDESVNNGKDATYWTTKNGANLASAIGYVPEMVWNDCCDTGFAIILGAGGGVSTIYPTPSWQTLNVTGLSALSTYSLPGQPGVSPRGIPDVSFNASPVHDPYLFCFTSPFTPTVPDCQLDNGAFGPNTFQNAGGGTSFGSPALAGLMAIINQKALNANPSQSAPDGRQGLANYVLYQLAAGEDFSSCNSSDRTDPTVAAPAGCIFNDVTVGNNGAPDAAGYYSATTGYDLASGLGSVDANNLVNSWGSVTASYHGSETTLSASSGSSISISHGQSVTVAVAVQKISGDTTSQAPSGSISLLAQGGTLTNSVGVLAAPLAGSASPVTTGNLTTSTLPGGSYNLLANFPGDGYFAGSSSNVIAVTVNPESSTTTLYGPTTRPYGTDITSFSADVAGTSGHGYPSGTVTLADGGTAFAQLKLNNQGVGSFLNCPFAEGILTPTPSTLPCFAPGVHVITATYSGDGSFGPSPNPPAASQTITLTINKGVPYMGIGFGSSGPNIVNATLTLTGYLAGVSLYATPPTGSIQFFDGTTPLGQANLVLVSGIPQASISTTFSQGVHDITASYSGDALYSSQAQTTEFENGVPIGWSATTTTQTIDPGKTATYNLTLSTATGFTGPVPLTCIAGTDAFTPGTSPPGVTCTLNVSSVTFDANTTTFSVVATINTTAQSRLAPLPWGSLPFAFAGVLALGMRKRRAKNALLFVAVLAVSAVTSCGGGNTTGGGQKGPPAATAVFTVWSSYPFDPNETVYNGVSLTTNINP